ncbi:MAG: tryptophan-rich sensory protein [Clostridia bacterium]|nr:tryptophan-rich sensory protein [Clostridia bacterium]
MSSKFKIYFKSILLPVLVGGVVGFIISPFIDYNSLQKPPLAPPSILFPIIWTVLYVLMGVSYGILKNNDIENDDIDRVYYLQLFFNALWPVAFFILKWRLFAAFWIVVLAILVIVMTGRFYRKNMAAGLLQIPYVFWTLFATYLNIGVYLLNR